MPLPNTKIIIWTEGQLLTQQQLQWQSDWSDARLSARWKVNHPNSFGWIRLHWEPGKLSQGMLALTEFEVILEDGQYYAYDAASAQQQVVFDLTTLQSDVILYLNLTRVASVQNLPGYPPAAGQAKWLPLFQDMSDQFDPGRIQEILTGEANWRLTTAPENQALSLPALRCYQDPITQNWQVDEKFFYPTAKLSACSALESMVWHLIADIEKNIASLDSEKGPIIALAKCLVYQIKHHCYQEEIPATIYGLLGQLLTLLSPDLSIPFYHHRDCHHCWHQLTEKWQRYFSKAPIQNNSSFQLQNIKSGCWQVQSIDDSTLEKAVWFIVMTMSQSLDEPDIKRFSEETKVASLNQVERLALFALSGLSLIPVRRPPLTLYQQYPGEYFQIKQEGMAWEGVCQDKSLALLLTPYFQPIDIKLLVMQSHEALV